MNATALRTLTEVLGFRSEPGREFSNLEKPAERVYQRPNAGQQFAVDVSQVNIVTKPDGKLEFSLDRNSLWRVAPEVRKATIKFDRIGEGELLKAMIDSGRVQALLVGQSGSTEMKVRGVVDSSGEKILDWEKHARGLTIAKASEPSIETATVLAALRFAQEHNTEFRHFAAANGYGHVDSGAQLNHLAEKIAGSADHGHAANPDLGRQGESMPIPPPSRARIR